jgi:hypothetical protein
MRRDNRVELCERAATIAVNMKSGPNVGRPADHAIEFPDTL